MNWQNETGFAPGAKRLDNGHKARQNTKTIVCANCGCDTHKIEDSKAFLSDALRAKGISGFDLDMIIGRLVNNQILLEYTRVKDEITCGLALKRYLSAIDSRRIKEKSYALFVTNAIKLNVRSAVIIACNENANIAWFKVVWSKYQEIKSGVFSEWSEGMPIQDLMGILSNSTNKLGVYLD